MNIYLKIPVSGILPACKILALYGAVLLLAFSTTAVADVWDNLDSFSDEYQENEGVEEFIWKEGSNNLPGYPQDKNLLEVAGPPMYQNYQYLIDEESLIVGQDGVVRYSIVIRSSGGSDNVLYDGLRCTTKQIKNYAYGSTDKDDKKKFSQKKNAQWRAFRTTGATAYGSILAANYFCDHNGAVLKRHEIIQNIKYGKGEVDGLYY